jgi:flagellar motility protein MotE (MotC chaperone)
MPLCLTLGAAIVFSARGAWGADGGKPEAALKGKTETKSEAKTESKKGDDKAAAKPETKDAKPTGKTDAPAAKADKAEASKGEKSAEKKDDKPVAGKKDEKRDDKAAAGKKDEKKDEKADKSGDKKNDKSADKGVAEKKDEKGNKKDDKSVDKKDDKKKEGAVAGAGTSAPGKKGRRASASDDEPAPPSTPPIKMSALRDEMSHPVHREERTGTRAEREKLEQLAGEIAKAREGLRQDTAKLEALLAARDAFVQAAPPSAPAGGDGEPGKKVPTSLDNLAKAIRGMKPEQAAPIISRVDRKLAADVLLRMPGGDAGKVMGVCKPEVAAELAAEIASRTPRAELKR